MILLAIYTMIAILLFAFGFLYYFRRPHNYISVALISIVIMAPISCLLASIGLSLGITIHILLMITFQLGMFSAIAAESLALWNDE